MYKVKRLVIAKGKIERIEGQIIVKLEIGIKTIYEYLLVSSALVFGLISIWIMTIEGFKIGLLFTLFLTLNLGVLYLIFKF